MIPGNEYYNDRVYQAQIIQELARNMGILQSGSLPFINSTLRLPIGMTAPTMFGQFQNAISGAFPGLGSITGMLTQPGMQAILPSGVNQIVNTMSSLPPLGGTYDPAGFMAAQLARGVGRGIPMVGLPFDFTNYQATDTYLAQRQAFSDYMGQFGGLPATPTNVQSLRMGAQADVGSLNQIIALRNAVNMGRENSGFNNAFRLMNGVERGLDSDAVFNQIANINDNAAADAFLNQTGNNAFNGNNRDTVRRMLNNARLASGAVSGIEFLSRFVGANAAETASVQSLGDALVEAFQIGSNEPLFLAESARVVGGMGRLSTAMATGSNNTNIPVANLMGMRLNEAFRQGPDSPFSGTRNAGYRRTQELLSSLANNGIVNTGGVDVYGSLSTQDVEKMSQSLMTQLEGFSEIAKVGRRMGLKVNELVQNLNSIYGGNLNQTLESKAFSILDRMQNTSAGQIEAQQAVDEENDRRSRIAGSTPLGALGTRDTQEFLRLRAQRMAGEEVSNTLAKTLTLGRFAGMDAKGTLAVANTINQMLQNVGMGGTGALEMTQGVMSMMADSRAHGMPVTDVQAVGTVTGMLAREVDHNESTRVFLAMKEGVRLGLIKEDDPKYQALRADYLRGGNLGYENVRQQLGIDSVTFDRLHSFGKNNATSSYTEIEEHALSGSEGPIAAIERALKASGDTIGNEAMQALAAMGGKGGVAQALLDIRIMPPQQVAEMLRKQNLSKEAIGAIMTTATSGMESIIGAGAGSAGAIDHYLRKLAFRESFGEIKSYADFTAEVDVEFSSMLNKAVVDTQDPDKNKFVENLNIIRAKRKAALAKELEAQGMSFDDAAREADNSYKDSFSDMLQAASLLSVPAQEAMLNEVEKMNKANLDSSDALKKEKGRRIAESIENARANIRAEKKKTQEDEARQAKADASVALDPSQDVPDASTAGTPASGGATSSRGSSSTSSTKRSLEDINEEVLAGIKELNNALARGQISVRIVT